MERCVKRPARKRREAGFICCSQEQIPHCSSWQAAGRSFTRLVGAVERAVLEPPLSSGSVCWEDSASDSLPGPALGVATVILKEYKIGLYA